MAENNEFSFENEAYRKTYWHTCSHVLAQAVKRLHPEVKLAIGPSIDNGFYYDFDAPFAFTPEIMEELEAEMRKICKEKLKLERFELPREEAIKYHGREGRALQGRAHQRSVRWTRTSRSTRRASLPTSAPARTCDSTGRIKGNAIKLTACNGGLLARRLQPPDAPENLRHGLPEKGAARRVSCQNRRGQEARPPQARQGARTCSMLTEEGPGFPFFLPKGMVLKNTLIDYWREVHKQLRLCRDLDPDDPQPRACGSARVTGTTTSRTCIPPSSTARITPSSP